MVWFIAGLETGVWGIQLYLIVLPTTLLHTAPETLMVKPLQL